VQTTQIIAAKTHSAESIVSPKKILSPNIAAEMLARSKKAIAICPNRVSSSFNRRAQIQEQPGRA